MEKEFYIVTPCYNDFESLCILLENINKENEKHKYNFSVIIVNDASLQENPFIDKKFENINQISQINPNKKRRSSKSHSLWNLAHKLNHKRTQKRRCYSNGLRWRRRLFRCI